jgi:hypothetical protein
MSTIVSVTDREKVVVTIGDAEVAREVAEVAAEAEAELDVQEEAEEMKAQEEEPEAEMAITITISAVLTYKVLTAKTRSDVLNTGLWLMCGIFFAGAAVVSLLRQRGVPGRHGVHLLRRAKQAITRLPRRKRRL